MDNIHYHIQIKIYFPGRYAEREGAKRIKTEEETDITYKFESLNQESINEYVKEAYTSN